MKTRENAAAAAEREHPGRRLGRGIGRGLLMFFTFVAALLILLLAVLKMFCSEAFPNVQRTFVTTMLETGQMKFMASLFLSADEIQAIVDENSMESFNVAVDTNLIQIDNIKSMDMTAGGAQGEAEEQKDIEIVEVAGATYTGTMMIVKDPSRVSLATIYPWREEGVTLDELVDTNDAIGGINGGIYDSYNNSGGKPFGVVVCNGEIQYNRPQEIIGLVLIGLTEDNILQIVDLSGMMAKDVEKLVEDMKIRDAVTFQEEASDANNHFVQLMINGEAREMNGLGSGLNPRTAIGQRADGTLLLFVTDGRGKSGHLGASSADLISVMKDFDAVNAANLDGGSSSCMYYEGEYLMPSVTFYHANSSWKLPLAFIVK